MVEILQLWMCGRKQRQLLGGFPAPVPLIQSLYKLPWQFDFLLKMTDSGYGKHVDLAFFSKHFVLETLRTVPVISVSNIWLVLYIKWTYMSDTCWLFQMCNDLLTAVEDGMFFSAFILFYLLDNELCTVTCIKLDAECIHTISTWQYAKSCSCCSLFISSWCNSTASLNTHFIGFFVWAC